MATIHRDNLVHLLASNFTEQDIAGKLGCTPEAVREAIAADADLALDVARARQYRRFDANLDRIQNTAAERLANAVAQEVDSMKLLKIVTGISSLSRRSQGEVAAKANLSQDRAGGVVELALPQRMQLSHVKNTNGEVVEVNGRPLVSKSSDELLKEVKAYEEQQQQENDEAPSRLPRKATPAETAEELLKIL
jgi:hypothetical protein